MPTFLITNDALACDIFEAAVRSTGIWCSAPAAEMQSRVMEVVDAYVKVGLSIVLGCTELSTLGLPVCCNDQPVIDVPDRQLGGT